MFQIKICGITSAKDARFASLAGVDAIGLNFYDKSSRYVDLATAEQIVSVIPKSVSRVGVFVNAQVDEINGIADRLELDYVQLHGDEPPEFLGNLTERKLLRAFRVGEAGFTPISDYLASCQANGRMPDAVLMDADLAGQFGGTGQTLDWSSVGQCRKFLGEIPLVLAGGLTPFNLDEAITKGRPDGVDVASGVESAPGTKDLLLMRAFCSTAKKAFAKLADGD